MSNTLLTIRKRLREAMWDGFREVLTTAIAASALIVSTNLNKWDGALDDYFNDWFVYIEDFTNAGTSRVLSDYATSGGSCTALGGNFSSDSADLATVMFTRIDPGIYLQAIQSGIRSADDKLFVSLDDLTLITGNILPNSHFEDQATSGTPDLYTLSNVTGTKTTTVGFYRGPRGTTSIKLTDSGSGGGYMYINSKTWPALLMLQGKTVSFYTDAYPATDDDAEIEIYTVSNDGSTTQTLTSDTSNVASQWTQLKLEDQTIDDDLSYIEFRWKVTTISDSIYFDNAYVNGLLIHEYLLPTNFRDGRLSDVHIQTSGVHSDPNNDPQMLGEERIFGYRVVDDGTYAYLRLPEAYASNYTIRLEGQKSLESLSSDSDTLSVDDPKLDLILAYAALEVSKRLQGMVGVTDMGRFNLDIGKWEFEVAKLSRVHKMIKPATFLKTR